MSDPRYQIIFHAQLVPGHSLEQVKNKLAALLKADSAKIERLFASAPCVLSKNLDADKAKQYLAALRKAGVIGQAKPMNTAPVPAPSAPPRPAAAAPAAPPRPLAAKPGLARKPAAPAPSKTAPRAKTGGLKTWERNLALAVIIAIGVGLTLRIWAANRLTALNGPSQIHQAVDGTVYILSNGVFYLHDAYGALLREIPLSQFGLDEYIGDFAVFNNGDLLLRRPISGELGVQKQAEILSRQQANEQDLLPPGQSVLQRCEVTTYQCVPFGKDAEVFRSTRTFKLWLDETAGRVFVADTANKQLLLLDEQGQIIRRSGLDFEFPNQVVLGQDGLLYVADTNHFRIVAVATEPEDFGKLRKEFPVLALTQTLAGRIWPMALGQTPAGEWWVINANTDMRDGYLMRYKSSGEFIAQVKLPLGADPIALLVTDKRALVADATLMRVYSVGLDGALEADFGALTFSKTLDNLRSQQSLYGNLKNAALLFLLLVLGTAYWVQRKYQNRLADEA